MADIVGKWTSGTSYGPVLTATDLYLLQTDLELHPILKGISVPSFVFNLSTGASAMFNVNDRERDLPFTQKHEPATIPRVTELIIVTRLSPWCTIVRSEKGVTLEDVCGQLWKDYSENFISEAEFSAIPARMQEQVKRAATSNQQANGWNFYHSPASNIQRFRRSDYLRNTVYFDRLEKEDDYSKTRLGFSAPNIFTMHMLS